MSRVIPSPTPLLIEEASLSGAWARAVLHVLDHAGTEIAPLVLSVTGFDTNRAPVEDRAVRAAVDALLRGMRSWDVETVAFTIFPRQIWEIAGHDRARFFTLCRDTFPRYQAMNRVNNGRGLYFQRLIAYGRGPKDGGNQLEYILSEYLKRPGVRRSMFQASTFDPGRDHVPAAQLGFPCLQQVSFVPTPAGLIVNAFYATQQLVDKAYGNYLGLARLGAFMAHEMSLSLARMNVFVGVAKLERIGKTDRRLTPVVRAARACLSRGETSSTSLASVTPGAA